MVKNIVPAIDRCITCGGRGCADCGNTGLENEAIQHGMRRGRASAVMYPIPGQVEASGTVILRGPDGTLFLATPISPDGARRLSPDLDAELRRRAQAVPF